MATLQEIVDGLPAADRKRATELIQALDRRTKLDKARENFLPFVHEVWPEFIEGDHHKIMANAFDRVLSGEINRLIINMPPRHTKSEFASFLLPAFFLGRFPNKKVMQTSHTGDLAVGFGRKVRNLLDSSDFHRIFPGVELSHDATAAGRWTTNARGEYFAAGTGGAVTGRGADLLIVDDPHSEQDAMSPNSLNAAYEWYTSGPRQRLQPGGSIIIVMTRWDERDLTGRIFRQIEDNPENADKWELIKLPALMESGRPVWPGFFTEKELRATKASIMPSKWEAQYQQEPTSEEGALVKREWWKIWNERKPPKCEFIIQSWDTAFKIKEQHDPSACTTWGVFYREREEDDVPDDDFTIVDGRKIKKDAGKRVANLILLDAFDEKLEFPDLKRRAKKEYDRYKPDALIIEAKASGQPLVHELRHAGIPVQEYSPSKGNDKVARVNAVSDLFFSGYIWVPGHKQFAQRVMDQFAAFPRGEHDDLVDSSTQALLRFRRGGFIHMDHDWQAEESKGPAKKAHNYFG